MCQLDIFPFEFRTVEHCLVTFFSLLAFSLNIAAIIATLLKMPLSNSLREGALVVLAAPTRAGKGMRGASLQISQLFSKSDTPLLTLLCSTGSVELITL